MEELENVNSLDDALERFGPDLITREQWADTRRTSRLTPEQRLCNGVFWDAMEHALGKSSTSKLFNGHFIRTSNRQRIMTERQIDAVLWLAGAQDCRITFELVCSAFQVDYDAARQAALKRVRPYYKGEHDIPWATLVYWATRGIHAEPYDYGTKDHAELRGRPMHYRKDPKLPKDEPRLERALDSAVLDGQPNLARVRQVVRLIVRLPLRHKHAIALLGRELTNATLHEIAKFIGVGSSGEVVYAVRRAEELARRDVRCRNQLDSCRAALGRPRANAGVKAGMPAGLDGSTWSASNGSVAHIGSGGPKIERAGSSDPALSSTSGLI